MKEGAIKSVDVARRAGVSRTTVSYVLNGRSDVSIPDDTRERVLRAAREIGYAPNLAARALASGRTNVVALWLMPARSSLHSALLDHVGRQFEDGAFDLVVARMRSLRQEKAGRAVVSQWPVDGILAFDGPDHVRAFLEARRAAAAGGPPLVNIGAYTAEGVDNVAVNLEAGAREAVAHLFSQGCRRVAYLVSEWGARGGDGRHEGYLSAVAAAGASPELIIAPGATRPDARDAVREYVRTHGHPEGLFCFSDDMALGAFRALRDAGLHVPEDVALVGCDGLEECEYVDPPLSTVAQPLERLCAAGWDLLRRRIEEAHGNGVPGDGGAPRHVVLLPELRVRASSLRAGGAQEGGEH